MPAAVSPLATLDIQRLLQGIFSDSGAPPDLAIEAFAVTAASLYGWCNPADIDRALALVAPAMPVPKCLHGRPWNACEMCPRACHGGAVESRHGVQVR